MTAQVGVFPRTLGRDPGELRRFLQLAAATASTTWRGGHDSRSYVIKRIAEDYFNTTDL